MKKILFWVFIFVFTVSLARAQDTATQQLLDKLSGQIQDMQEAQAQETKRLDALEKQIADLGDKMNQPAANNYASADDLKALAAQVQEIDKKREDDKELILKNLEQLGKVSTSESHSHKSSTSDATTTSTSADNSATTPAGPQKGYYYPVKSGDTLSGIAKAYRESDKHVKVTTKDILKANPGLDANKLIAGQKIFIPDANAK
jgi:LysM repeat protein